MSRPTSRIARGLSRRAALGVAAAGVLACLVPTLRHAPLCAEPSRDQVEAAQHPASQPKPKDKAPTWRAAFRKDYGLNDGEVLKHVRGPYPASRADYCKHLQANYFPRMDIAKAAMTYHWKGNDVDFSGISPADGPDGVASGVPLLALLGHLGIAKQQIEIPEALRFKQVPGEFVMRAGAPPEKVIPRLQQILRDELKLPLQLKLKHVERDVIVVTGKYQSKPRPNRKANEIDLFAVQLQANAFSGKGTFNAFLDAAGSFVGRRFVNELTETPKATIIWHGHRTFEIPDLNAHPEGVLRNLAAQTGLTFNTEERNVPVLFVEEVRRP